MEDAAYSHAYNTWSEQVRITQEPITFNEAMSFLDKNRWKEAMDREYESLLHNKTWSLVLLPEGRKAVKCKWNYKMKYKPNGDVERYKARVVAKGFSQVAGMDYDETYALVINPKSVRMMFAIAATYKMHMVQFDIGMAFLNGKLKEEIYMLQPEGYEKPRGLVCKLERSIYGLKQVARQWNEHFDNFLKQYKLKVSIADPCVYFNTSKIKTIVGIHVDDGLACSTDRTKLNMIIKHVEKEFEVKQGAMDYYVGFQVHISEARDKIFINQSRYISDILERFEMTNCHLIATPLDPAKTLLKSQGEDDYELGEEIPYKEAIRSLMYPSCITRLDIDFVVSDAAKWSKRLRRSHWTAVKRILRYLRRIVSLGIVYHGNPVTDLVAVGYGDADFAIDPVDRKSRTGVVITLGNGAIIWSSKRQPYIAQSTTEAELIAANETCQEATWLRNLLNSINIVQKEPTLIFCDNQSSIKMIKNHGEHAATKHIDIRFLWIKEKIDNKTVKVEYLNTKNQIADILTKGVPRESFNRLRAHMGMVLK
jgi:hypothetical protein